MFSCFHLVILLVLEFMLTSQIYLSPFLEYSSLAFVRCEFFTGGCVCDVRADIGPVVSLKFLFGFFN